VNVETLLSIAVGIGLSAACGFRVFVPLFGIGLAARSGLLALSPGFEWMSSGAALVALGTAVVLEVLAYYVPWLDNLLDTLTTPAALVAGALASAAVFVEMPPLWRWALAVIAGSGAAGLVQAATVVARAKSSACTAGAGNALMATGELLASALTAILAILVPIVCLAFLALGLAAAVRLARRAAAGPRGPTASPPPGPSSPAGTPASPGCR
jgi:hypothetical protein